MNEMDQLTRFRAEVPLRASPRAEHLFQQALQSQRPSPSRQRVFLSRGGGGKRRFPAPLRLALTGATAAAVAAGVIVAIQPSGRPVLTVQLLADRAATAALDQPAIPAGQWIYALSETTGPATTPADVTKPSPQDGWMTADGTLGYGSGFSFAGHTILPYDKLGSLPTDPAALLTYLRNLDSVASDDTSSVEFSTIMELMLRMVVPPTLEAELYHALALIPNVQVRQQVTDIAGRTGVAFVLPPTKQSEQLELILDTSDYHLLAQAAWDDPAKASSLSETAILKQYPVDEVGSTQPSTAPPSAAMLAAEQVARGLMADLVRDHHKLIDVKPGQWLYRDLRTGDQDRKVWATADDSVQAEDVNGTLQVCKRTDPCAASEQWLMRAGPSYALVHPQYPQGSPPGATPTPQASPVQPVPSLPDYPRPLFDKLSTYSTGCTDAADGCNVVNVIASVLTGYGNYPSLGSRWFFALADVPGVSVQNITDAAGNQDIEFTFPFHDGVTGILVSTDTIQHLGYVRDGQQTLVMNQALVSGPGVLPAP